MSQAVAGAIQLTPVSHVRDSPDSPRSSSAEHGSLLSGFADHAQPHVATNRGGAVRTTNAAAAGPSSATASYRPSESQVSHHQQLPATTMSVGTAATQPFSAPVMTLPPPPPRGAVLGKKPPLPVNECDSELASFRDGPPLPSLGILPPPLLPPSSSSYALGRLSPCKDFDGQFSDDEDSD